MTDDHVSASLERRVKGEEYVRTNFWITLCVSVPSPEFADCTHIVSLQTLLRIQHLHSTHSLPAEMVSWFWRFTENIRLVDL